MNREERLNKIEEIIAYTDTPIGRIGMSTTSKLLATAIEGALKLDSKYIKDILESDADAFTTYDDWATLYDNICDGLTTDIILIEERQSEGDK